MSTINYDVKGKGAVLETAFDSNVLGKYEAILSQGNGYLGVRAATEESYLGECRNTFVAGTFNKANEQEVTELPNLPDVIGMTISIDGYLLDLNQGTVSQYERRLAFETGELTRTFTWELPTGKKVACKFKRIVSKANLHVIAQQVTIQALTADVAISVCSGINGRQTNSGSQHFFEGDKRISEENYLQMYSETTESRIGVLLSSVTNFSEGFSQTDTMSIERRVVAKTYSGTLNCSAELVIEKLSTIYTTRDQEWLEQARTIEELKKSALKELQQLATSGYQQVFEQSALAWQRELWQSNSIAITSTNKMDQLAVNFCLYHLHIMTPFHDERLNIGAKGLSGEGYKGHTFWDTEVFLLPYFVFHYPQKARNLLTHRYLGLDGAKRKAQENGYQGAMYPWESAWITDGETTPRFGEADIVTGRATEILTGLIEHHISSDIPFGINNYLEATNDLTFMQEHGNEVTVETALFWLSRVSWNQHKQVYEILDVIGPDEYKEHVNNNAYTNYMAYWTIKQGLTIGQRLFETDQESFKALNQSGTLTELLTKAAQVLEAFYLPQPTDLGILPQDDSYLTKKDIELSPYKEAAQVGTIFKEYNLAQVNELQVSKQADVLLLILLQEQLFDMKTKQLNWAYYEPRTLHDSSLSLATHSILASDLDAQELAYDLFRKATEIDLGNNMASSDAGIHSAAMGGIWQSVFYGFAGIRLVAGQLRIEPKLPANWQRLAFSFYFQGSLLKLVIAPHQFTLTAEDKQKVCEFYHQKQRYLTSEPVTITY